MNSPDYCQGIYEAARKVVEHYHRDEMVRQPIYLERIYRAIDNLERALDGKDKQP